MSGRVIVVDNKILQLDGKAVVVPTDPLLVGMFQEDITEIDIPYGIKTLGNRVFYQWNTLTAVSIPKTVTEIGSHSFNATSITKIVIPDSVEKIGGSTFSACYKLKDIYLGKGIKNIGNQSFIQCNAVENVYYNGTIYDWMNIKFSWLFGNPLRSGSESLILPINGFVKDDNGNYYEPTSIVIPEGTTTLGLGQFWGFRKCSYLEIPSTMKTLGQFSCGIGNSETGVLSTIRVKATTPPTISNETFMASRLDKIIVPKGYGDTYRNATNWTAYADYIVEESE